MSPAKISYRIRGKEGLSVTAEDGTWAVLTTPVGIAKAVTYEEYDLAESQLPGDSGVMYLWPDRPSVLKHIVHDIFKVKKDRDSRTESYETVDGKVEIEVKVW